MNVVKWLLALVASLILLQTLFFKFSGHESSVAIFSALNMEPAGRIGSGVVELLAGIALLVPAWRFWGAALGLGTISGAIYFHLTSLGIGLESLDAKFHDQGSLFFLALTVWAACAILLVLDGRHQIARLRKN